MKSVHLCPVCRGNGLVPNGFYTQTSGQWSTTSTTPEPCRPCFGTGIIILDENNTDERVTITKGIIDDSNENLLNWKIR